MSAQEAVEACNKLVATYAPDIARSMMVTSAAQALGNAAHNATFVQQQQNIIVQTNTAVSVEMLHAIGAAHAGK